MVPGRALEVQNASANHKTGKDGGVGGELAASQPKALHTSKTFLPGGWAFVLQAPYLTPEVPTKASTGSSLGGHTLTPEPLPMLFLQPGMPHDPPTLQPLCLSQALPSGLSCHLAAGLYARRGGTLRAGTVFFRASCSAQNRASTENTCSVDVFIFE